MKKAVMTVFLFATTLFAGFEYSVISLSGGCALYAGAHAGDMYPGVHGVLETSTAMNDYFGGGLHLDYTWFAGKTASAENGKSGYHFLSIAPVSKGYLNLNENARAFIEFDPGLVLVISYFPAEDRTTDFSFITRYGQTYGIGMNLKELIFGVKLQQVFFRKHHPHELWFVFYLGYAGL
ncbi:MAG: hypothetical protein JXA18_16565 [Chitinispirillaceae bacterium]|nr:hypothetical protein [Chitinispirillaceae bacterium]